jgi:hypothetical protein
MNSAPTEANAFLNAGSKLLHSVVAECNLGEKCINGVVQESKRRNWEGDEVRVQLGEFLPILLQAALDRSAWLDDFETETLVISKDLHEVLSTYYRMHPRKRKAG